MQGRLQTSTYVCACLIVLLAALWWLQGEDSGTTTRSTRTLVEPPVTAPAAGAEPLGQSSPPIAAAREPVTLPAGPHHHHADGPTDAVEPIALFGTVRTLAGVPIPRAEIAVRKLLPYSLIDDQPGTSPPLDTSRSKADGTFCLSVPADSNGWLQFDAAAPGLAPSQLRLAEPGWRAPLTVLLGGARSATVLVRGPQNQPVGGARVWLTVLESGATQVFEGTTDPKGRWHVQIPQGFVTAEAVKPGLSPGRASGHDLSDHPQLIVHLGEAATVWGTVTDRDTGAPIVGAVVRARKTTAPARANAVTDGEGRYRIDTAPAGVNFSLTAFPPAGQPHRFLPSSREVALAAGNTLRYDLEVQRRAHSSVRVHGRMLDEMNLALSGVEVHVRGESGTVTTGRSRSDGTFTLDVPLGSLSFWAVAERRCLDPSADTGGHRFRWSPWTRPTSESDWDLGDLRMRPAREVRGMVRTVDGKSAPGALVSLRGSHWSFQGRIARRPGEPWTAVADAEGRFRFVDAPCGEELTLTVSHPSSATMRETFVGPNESELELIVHRGAALRGVLELPDGSPAAHCVLLWRPPREFADARSSGDRLQRTDAAGRFFLSDVTPKGDLFVRTPQSQVSRQWYLPPDQVRQNLVEGAETEVHLRLVPTVALCGRLLYADRLPAAGFRLEVDRALQGPADGHGIVAHCDQNGRFQLEGLAATEYRVRVCNSDGQQIDAFTGIAGGTDVEWTLRKSRTQ